MSEMNNHGLNFQSGKCNGALPYSRANVLQAWSVKNCVCFRLLLMRRQIQSWNKLCFSSSTYIEVSISLPGTPSTPGFWPGAWTMGNLGRAGYGATTEGMWPYRCVLMSPPHLNFRS